MSLRRAPKKLRKFLKNLISVNKDSKEERGGDEREEDDRVAYEKAADERADARKYYLSYYRHLVVSSVKSTFIPQWDEQLLSPGNSCKIERDYDNPPKPLSLSKVPTHHCSTCGLTWLIGGIGEAAAGNHPSHQSYSHESGDSGRSLLVSTHGACSGSGKDARAAVGVHFAPNSKHNFGELEDYPDIGKPTKQQAEILAVTRALKIVRSNIRPERRTMVTAAIGGNDPAAISDFMHLRVIVITNSSYIVEGVCGKFSDWKEEVGLVVNKAGMVVDTYAGFLLLKEEVEGLSTLGVEVAYYLVDREENKEAEILAKRNVVWL